MHIFVKKFFSEIKFSTFSNIKLMQPIKSKNALLVVLYISAMFNLRYYLTFLLYPGNLQKINQISPGNPRWIVLPVIYLPVAVCVAFGVIIVRYLSPVYLKSSNLVVRITFVVWAVVTLFFPLAVNKVYFTLPFAVRYGFVYLVVSWVMLSQERIQRNES